MGFCFRATGDEVLQLRSTVEKGIVQHRRLKGGPAEIFRVKSFGGLLGSAVKQCNAAGAVEAIADEFLTKNEVKYFRRKLFADIN
ncbi:hypothetical protein R1flu_024572 [Riccia fluitans]|uniref:Uncharacterized protein n=1 Tax=Riccia fluitans TaxID=41844 RepID=A0ABD1XVP3_9MARC